jgi:MoaA/NifB/PqqE/SkfB family radical SAM enzyme
MVSPSKEDEYLMRKYLLESGHAGYFDLHIWPLISRAGSIQYGKPHQKQPHHERIFGCTQGMENNIYSWFHIHANGKVVLCCQDWFQEEVLGDVNYQSISEIWNGEKYLNMLDKVFGKIESNPNFLCKRCESAIAKPTMVTALPLTRQIMSIKLFHRMIEEYAYYQRLYRRYKFSIEYWFSKINKLR